MRSIAAVAALAMLVGCTEATSPKLEDEVKMASALPSPEDDEPDYPPTKPTTPKVWSRLSAACYKSWDCRKNIAPYAGEAFAVLYKQRQYNQASLVKMAPAPEAEAAMKAGYSMSCEIPSSSIYVYEPMSLRCTIKFLGGLVMTLILPWECATGVGCVAGAVAAGYAWDDFFTDQPTNTQDEANRYLRDWAKDPVDPYGGF